MGQRLPQHKSPSAQSPLAPREAARFFFSARDARALSRRNYVLLPFSNKQPSRRIFEYRRYAAAMRPNKTIRKLPRRWCSLSSSLPEAYLVLTNVTSAASSFYSSCQASDCCSCPSQVLSWLPVASVCHTDLSLFVTSSVAAVCHKLCRTCLNRFGPLALGKADNAAGFACSTKLQI